MSKAPDNCAYTEEVDTLRARGRMFKLPVPSVFTSGLYKRTLKLIRDIIFKRNFYE